MRLPRVRFTVRRLMGVLAVGLTLPLLGCEPYYAYSAQGLLAPAERAEPFDPRLVGEWYGPAWEHAEWKVERLMDTDTYFITHFGDKGEKTFYRAAVVKVSDLRLMDLQEVPAQGRPARPHLLMKVVVDKKLSISFGTQPPLMAKRIAVLGGGPLTRSKVLKFYPPTVRFFADHPGLVTTQKAFNDQGQPTGLMLAAPPKDLREFFEKHGADAGLWPEESKVIAFEARSNQGDDRAP